MNHWTLTIVCSYLAVCVLIGLIGRRRKWGGWAYFFGSVCMTPLIGFMLLMASDPRKDSA